MTLRLALMIHAVASFASFGCHFASICYDSRSLPHPPAAESDGDPPLEDFGVERYQAVRCLRRSPEFCTHTPRASGMVNASGTTFESLKLVFHFCALENAKKRIYPMSERYQRMLPAYPLSEPSERMVPSKRTLPSKNAPTASNTPEPTRRWLSSLGRCDAARLVPSEC